MRSFFRLPAHLWVALSNWGTRGVSMVVQLVSLPLLTSILGASDFAAYSVLVSLMAWYQLADFGFGNTTQNAISESRAQSQDAGIYVSLLLTICMCVLVVGVLLLIPISPWMGKFLLGGFTLQATTSSAFLAWLTGILFLGNMLGVSCYKALYAMHLGVYANFLMMLPSLIFVALLWTYVPTLPQSQHLLGCLLAYAGPLGALGVGLAVVMMFRFCKTFSMQELREVIGATWLRAGRFWLLAVLSAAVLNIDYIVMSRTLAAQEIATYNILYRFFWVAMTLYSSLLGATWPVFSELGAQRKWREMHRYIRLYIYAGILGVALLTLGMNFGLQSLLHFVAPKAQVHPNWITLLLFGIYIGFRIWTDTYGVALQSINQVNALLKWVPLQALINISFQFILSRYLGINGILLGLILSFLLTASWALPIQFHQYCKENTIRPHI